jgi:hypothetical protein
MAVFLVRIFSYRVAQTLGSYSQNQVKVAPTCTTERYVTWVCAAICALCLAPPGGDAMVTYEEFTVFVFLVVYIACYILAYVCATHSTDPPIYNMIAASIQLIVIRLYCGTQTPYNPVLLWAVSTRSFYKIRSAFSVTSTCTILLDSVLLSLMCTLGFECHVGYLLTAGVCAFCTGELFP